MTPTTIIRSAAMKLAHALKNLGYTFPQAIKTAWKLTRLKFKAVATFEFAKVDTGEVRAAKGHSFSTYVSKANELLVKYYDMDKQAYRSFRLSNLI